MAESGRSSSTSGEEYYGADVDDSCENLLSTTKNCSEAPQIAVHSWKAREKDELADDAHRRFDGKQLMKKTGGRVGKDAYKATTKQTVKAIRKQTRNQFPSSANSSKMTSPEVGSPDNPFSFPHVASTSAIGAHNHLPLAKLQHQHLHRNRKIKKRSKDRSYDRDLKLLGADYDRGIHSITTQDLGFSKPAYEVETSSRFLSLASRLVEKEDQKDGVERLPGFRRQSLSRSISKWPNCPRERIKFYDSFSVLIELGSKAKRTKEEAMRRNITAEAVPEAWRNELNDVLWLELQGWMYNRDMHNQDKCLMFERDKIDETLYQIYCFKIDDPEICAPCSDACLEIDFPYLHALHLAFRHVSTVLHQLDDVEHLYPCTKKIGLSHPLYDRTSFQDKVKALIMWINFYVQLGFRLQAVAGIVSGRKLSAVFPQLLTSLEDEPDDTILEIAADVVDGGSNPLESSSRSGFSSRASSFYDLCRLDSSGSQADVTIQAVLRQYLEKGLHKKGLERSVTQIQSLIFPTLRHILENLAEPVAGCFSLSRQTSVPEGHHRTVDIVKLWCDLHRESNLPCLDRVFGYLLRLPIRTLQEGIRLRLEQRPEAEPDLPSLSQLIHECKDTLVLSITIRNDYISLGQNVRHHDIMLGDIRILDDLMKRLLELYLEYLQQWILTLQKEAKASRLQKTILEDEWKFMTSLCGGIENAELELPKMFCSIVQGLLTGVGSLLDSGLDDFISGLYSSSGGENGFSPSKDTFRQFFRDCKAVFVEARERCFKLLEFTKLLYKDLEIAALYEVLVPTATFLNQLAESNHHAIELVFSDMEKENLGKLRFFVSPSTANNIPQITKLLNATLGARDQDAEWEGYLLIMPACQERWSGMNVKIDAGALTAIRHSHVGLTVGHVMMVVLRNSVLTSQSKQFEKRMPKDSMKIEVSQTTCHQLITDDLENIKEESLELGKKICQVIQRLQNDFVIDQFPEISETDRTLMVKNSRELLHQSYNFCIEYHREIARLNFNDEEVLSRQLFCLATQWINFAIQKCERGHGTRPRWSTPGLDYLTVAVKPNYTRYQTDEEFQNFKNLIDSCVTHVIGEPPPPGMKTPTESPTTFYLSPPQSSLSLHRSSLSQSQFDGHLSVPSRMSSKSDTTISFESSDEEESEYYDPRHRMEEATAKLDKKRNDKLVESKIVGRVVATDQNKTISHLKARKVDFRWRMCAKLGSGRHADVFKAMNLDTGGLVAVKKFFIEQATFEEKVTKVATEIEWLAGLNHPNVVKYYGVEIHRNELMLFMEFCDGGTLSDLARQGLDIMMVRVYTKQLLLGISYLHDSGICHLDIKGQNIFLTSAGIVKLGDFSEMVKLENGDTKTNEISGNVGTPRFMSPEMIRGEPNAKIGRASDIWSLGCVVVEMITGKTPKFDKDDNEFAIMFHVGGGGRPKIPDTLSSDAKDFLDHCFEKEPQNRWRSQKLLSHPFVTVELGEYGISV